MEDAKATRLDKLPSMEIKALVRLIMHLFGTLVVRQPSPFSDHCQLITWIKINSSLLINDEESFEDELFSLPSIACDPAKINSCNFCLSN